MNLTDIPKEQTLSHLPEVFVEELGHVLSLEGIIWLIQKFGGTEVCVPKDIACVREKFYGLSEDDLNSLCHQVSGSRLEVPRGAKLRRFVRNRSIIQMRHSGNTIPAIAKQFEMTERNVSKIFSSFTGTQEPGND